MTRQELVQQIKLKRSFLCVGLDVDVAKLPLHLRDKGMDGVREFCFSIIDSTAPYCMAYKPNTAFFEALGKEGWEVLMEVDDYLHKNYSKHFCIADAKRGDIGNTSQRYAEAFYRQMNFDAVTVAPYMGKDSVAPFITEGKWTILLLLTSNEGAHDFQLLPLQNGQRLYEQVALISRDWGSADNLMYVTGATRAEELHNIRKLLPEHFFLVPGVGAQGGSLDDVARYGMNNEIGLMVNASRSILYASSGTDFATAAAREAQKLQQEMEAILTSKGFI
jgi:orotidine-5'-phosphate decarboxylase